MCMQGTLFVTVVLIKLCLNVTKGVFIRTRKGGKLFNLAHLKAKTKTITELIIKLLFADDTALTAHSKEDMKEIIDAFMLATKEIGLKININKTEIIFQPAPGNETHPAPEMKTDGNSFEVLRIFKYLGHTLTTDNRLDQEVQN